MKCVVEGDACSNLLCHREVDTRSPNQGMKRRVKVIKIISLWSSKEWPLLVVALHTNLLHLDN
jgi:hypothetical protein